MSNGASVTERADIPKTNGGEDVIPYVDRAIAIIKESGVNYRVGYPRVLSGGMQQRISFLRAQVM